MITFFLPMQNFTHEFRWVHIDSPSACALIGMVFAIINFEIFSKNDAGEARIHDRGT